jgi:hypothetical protein
MAACGGGFVETCALRSSEEIYGSRDVGDLRRGREVWLQKANLGDQQL